MALLSLKDIGKIYVSEGNVSVGIRGVNLTFERGEFVAVTGKSGSGKSTLINLLMRFLCTLLPCFFPTAKPTFNSSLGR